MLHILRERLHQKYRTLDYPAVQPSLSPRYKGRPVLRDMDCGAAAAACIAQCPAGALLPNPAGAERTPLLDMGRCLFCGACASLCPEGAIAFSTDHHVAVFRRADLIISPIPQDAPVPAWQPPLPERDYSLYKRSLKLRQVSAGGCGACEADCNVLGTLAYDLGKFGIEFAASPRHADGLVVTGPVTAHMRQALLDTWEALPEPCILIAVGACAISGGLFRDCGPCRSTRGEGGLDGLLPVDVYVPGCPPNPWSILDGILSVRHTK